MWRFSSRMRFVGCFLVIVVACLVPAVRAQAQGGREPNVARQVDIPKTGSIKGRVLDAATGEPLRDLTVGLANASNGAPVQTDPAGRFRWTGLNRHAYVVNLWPGSGYVARRVVADLSRADTVDGIEIRAHSAAVLTGRVENAHQRPVPGLRVSATAAGMVRGLYPASVRGSATTDDLGGFRIGDLPPGRYFLRVDLPPRSVEAVRAVQDPDELPVSEATTGDVATYYPNSAPMEGAATITVSAGQVVEGIRVSLAQERTMCVLWRLPQAEGPHAPVVKARVESAQRQGHNALAAGSIGGGKGARPRCAASRPVTTGWSWWKRLRPLTADGTLPCLSVLVRGAYASRTCRCTR
ncbi:MAG: carboxypeptidase regulatory-like domain-containing protein [Bryobacterales bacterium]|nr:carboxypeptidase regulatory-like domain-containing protein [Bryobacterales bacterium]